MSSGKASSTGSPARADVLSWDAMFMGVAMLAAARSKDPKTQNGACIVSPANRILGVGYNGLPRGCSDSDPIYWSDQDDGSEMSKHLYVVHAEVNAILNCVVLPLTGASIYATQFPCPQCTQAIIQAGISAVVYLRDKPHHNAFNKASERMFKDAGVQVLRLSAHDALATSNLNDVLDTTRDSSDV